MATDTTTLLDRASIRSTFEQWHTQHLPLEDELRESLAALAAFQSHLDEWQAQLVQDRQRLAADREQLAIERTELEKRESSAGAEQTAELAASREKIAALTSALLERTEELRRLDSQRAELIAELGPLRALEKELKTDLEQLKQSREQERTQSADELRRLRELLERRIEAGDEQAQPAEVVSPRGTRSKDDQSGRSSNSPVLESIVEQFGKLRQQRAQDRSAHQKAR